MFEIIFSVLLGYLVGSVSFSRIVLRLKSPGRDISDLAIEVGGTDESEPVSIYGANAASMILGTKYGIAIGVLDMLKAALPMIVTKFYIFPGRFHYLLVSIGALLGHNWPLYHRFRGGRGFSIIFGSFIVIDWFGAIVEPVLGILLGMFVAGNPMIAYIIWLWFLPIWFWFRLSWGTAQLLIAYSLVVISVFMIATRPEIKMVTNYMKAGRLENYREAMYESSPRWRGMKRMQDWINELGRARYAIGFIVLAVTILVLISLSHLPPWLTPSYP
jgi:glycerol-3-phosphate acyltransferase PlsY